MKVLRITLLLISSGALLLLNGCAIMEQNAELKAENRNLRQRVNMLEKDIIRMRQYVPREQREKLNYRTFEDMSGTGRNSTQSGEAIVLTEQDLQAMARDRAGLELNALNRQIRALSALSVEADASSLEYALAWRGFSDNLSRIKANQPFYEELIEPNLTAMPPEPTTQAKQALADYLADQERLAEERALREREIQAQQEAAAVQKEAAENTAAAAVGAAAAAEESRSAAERSAEAAESAAEAADDIRYRRSE